MAALEQPTPTAVRVDVDGMTEEQLEERAYELEQEAEQHRLLARSLIGECARLRSRAERMRQEEAKAAELRAKKGKRKQPALPWDPNDPLIAAASLATEDLDAGFTAADLAEVLRIGVDRAGKLLLALQADELVARMGENGKWRAVDPEVPRVRDAARGLGTFTDEQLAEAAGMTVLKVVYYRELLHAEEIIVGAGPMYEYRKAGPERVITKVNDGRYRLPEHDPPAGVDAPKRGEPVLAQNHGERGRAGQNPQQRHKMHLRDSRRRAMETAKAERAEKQRAKAQAKTDPHAAKRAKGAAKRRARLIS